MAECKHYLYRHIIRETSEVFYVGIGTKTNTNVRTWKQEYNRAFHFHNRNKKWKVIFEANEIDIEIIMESDNYDFMLEKEKEFISLWKERLTNITSGGQGCKNRNQTKKARQKISDSKKGSKNPMSREIVNIKTGKQYGSIKEASVDYKYTYDHLISCLNEKRKRNTTNFRYKNNVVK